MKKKKNFFCLRKGIKMNCCPQTNPGCGVSVVSVQPVGGCNSPQNTNDYQPSSQQNSQQSQTSVCGNFACNQEPVAYGDSIKLPNVVCKIPGKRICHKPRTFPCQEICVPPQVLNVPAQKICVPEKTWQVTLVITTPSYEVQGPCTSVTWPGCKVQSSPTSFCEEDVVIPEQEVCISLPPLCLQNKYSFAGPAKAESVKPVTQNSCNSW